MFVTDTMTSDDIFQLHLALLDDEKKRHCMRTLNFKFCIEEETVNFNQSNN